MQAEHGPTLNVRNHPIELIASNGPTALKNIGLFEEKEERVYHLSGRGKDQYHRKNTKYHGNINASRTASFINTLCVWIRISDGDAVIINNIDADNKTLRVDRNPKGWAQANSQVSTRIIGFYYDGYDVNERLFADDYISYTGDWRKSEPESGAYCSINANTKTIKLSQDIPNEIKEKIQLKQTVIRNHYESSTYIYPFYHGDNKVIKDAQWHTASHLIHGTSAEFGVSNEKFRKGTRFIKLGIYCNVGGDIWFNNLKFEEQTES